MLTWLKLPLKTERANSVYLRGFGPAFSAAVERDPHRRFHGT